MTIDGAPIQINYATRYFSDFFADSTRARMFWAMASDERQSERDALLAKEPAFRRLSAEDRALLSSVRKRELEDAEIERDMADLAERIGADRLVFVTHVNANTPDNRPIERRQQLINAVRAGAKRIGVPCYDPTPLMREIGQMLAMDNDGLDLTHYSDLFSDRLSADWNRRIQSPSADSFSPSRVALIALMRTISAVSTSSDSSAVAKRRAWPYSSMRK